MDDIDIKFKYNTSWKDGEMDYEDQMTDENSSRMILENEQGRK